MKNNKGFTLVELLAVIAILAILVIIALPNVMGMFNQAKKNSFTTELKNIYKVAQQQWMTDSMIDTGDQVYSRCDTCTTKSLQLSGRTELDYLIVLNKSGDVVEYYATDGTYQFGYNGDGLFIEDITDVETVAGLTDNRIMVIKNDDVNSLSGFTGPTPVSFATDSWDTIKEAVLSNNTSAYSVGDTKTIDMGSLGVHTVRVVNNSRPSECSNPGFSQSSCGLVIEFVDIVSSNRMYETNFNYGGWENSIARTYINNELFGYLPDDLRRNIGSTTIISGHGSDDTGNFETHDDIFLLSTKEVWGKESTSNVVESDTAEAQTRQLDYYRNMGVTTSNYSGAIKKNSSGNGAAWLLRTAGRGDNDAFYGVSSTGNWTFMGSSTYYGISPAFKIGLRK